MEHIENYIKQNIKSRNKLLTNIATELIESGGKRLRPALTVISAKFGNFDRTKIVSIAAALEVLHMATLVHDDIIDRSKLRRGKATVFEKHGPDMAVYIGDYLFTKALLMLSVDVPSENMRQNMEQVAGSIKSICEGEVDQFQDRFNLDTTVYMYLKRIKRKTAVLFAAACALGSHMSECSENTVRSLYKFGLFLGMAFQIRDDINDFYLESEDTGKSAGIDITKGVITLPVIYSLKKEKSLKDIILSFSEKNNKNLQQDVLLLGEIIRKSGGVEKSIKMLDRYIDKGMGMLETLPENEHRKILEDIIKTLRVNLMV